MEPRDGTETMGVAFENNLMALFWVLLVLAAIGGLGVALWKPVGRRAWRYFVCWWQRDQMREREARAEIAARRRAEREVAGDCYGADIPSSAGNNASPLAATFPAEAAAPPHDAELVCCEPATLSSEPLLPAMPTTPTAHLYSRN